MMGLPRWLSALSPNTAGGAAQQAYPNTCPNTYPNTYPNTFSNNWPTYTTYAQDIMPDITTQPGDYVIRKVANGWIIMVAPSLAGGEVREYVCHQDADIGDAIKAAMVTEQVVDK